MRRRKTKKQRESQNKDSLKRRKKVIAFLVTVVIVPVIIAYAFYFLQKRDEQRNYLLKGALEKNPVNPTEKFTVQLGQFRIIADYNDLANGINLRKWVNIGYDYPIKIKIGDGKLLISASFNDKNGKMIANIVDNQWEINRDNYCDRNFSINTLEVVDKDKIPLLQVDIRNGNNIFIGGVFYFPTIRLFMSDGNSIVTGDPTFNDSIALKKMKRIFKYPSRKYLGVKDSEGQTAD